MNAGQKRKMGSGIYLIIDPSMDEKVLLNKLDICLNERLAAVQIWDNFKDTQDITTLICKICDLCHAKNVPVLINNQWGLLNKTDLDGIHFDIIPEDYEEIKAGVNKSFISGLTCNNDLSWVEWANRNNLDYISFCSVFPSQTANSCEIVHFNTIQKASKHYDLPIYLAGGITANNLGQLKGLNFKGIAVVSGIMGATNPSESINNYLKELNKK
ncbi:thiamine phosphate synthase [Arenibacter aquaticus]|uniref:Thiamine phosphate synthase n=1 Tax=Arenibacter aquaticus TaxID=2489054 RepID=A0A430JYH5_9FLAO|nr:thiamine phosphate synthase [Arenibacter aquaticus]RTE51847.1 thiamine phosphate synthase [Arenibacter aquaticus]